MTCSQGYCNSDGHYRLLQEGKWVMMCPQCERRFGDANLEARGYRRKKDGTYRLRRKKQ
jgi:hypothetical protein